MPRRKNEKVARLCEQLNKEETENMHLRRILTQPCHDFNKGKYKAKIVYFNQTGQTSIVITCTQDGIKNLSFIGDEFELKKKIEEMGDYDKELQDYKSYLYKLLWEVDRIRVAGDN